MSSRTARKTPSRHAVLLRNIGFGIAVALGGVGIWLIVTGGDSTQRIEIGVLTGLWGLLLGAICGRRLVLAEPPAGTEDSASSGSTELAVPESAEVERVVAAAAQRAFASELQEMLRREFASAVDDAVAREVSELRAEIAELRQELLDKVGGQLRLERIETTRLIGSDLEAMRAEVRRLKSANEPAMLAGDLDLDLDVDEQSDVVAAPGRVVDAGPETARIPRVPAAEVAPEAEPAVQAVQAVPEPAPQAPAEAEASTPEPAPEPAAAAAPEPVPAPAPTAEPAAPPAPAEPPAPSVPAGDSDPFAGLPRLSPFTDFALDPTDSAGEHAQADSEANDAATEAATTPPAAAARGARHRRRRSDDPAGEELLAQLLAREGVRR